MTTEEKLQHFLDTCMEDARARSSRMLDEYMAALEETFQEHKKDAERRADMALRQETEKIRKETNKTLSIKQIALKRTLGQKLDELKDKLFVELRDMLGNFMETPEYQALLEAQIARAVEFAGSDPVTVYIDPADEDKLHRLALHHGGANLLVSEYSFLGGCRAVIPARHILIDNSFQTKLEEARENFHFNLNLAEGGESND
ncbi:MAG: V-type ATP synthase subunit E [Eubacteriales bacterium]|nr:V-type ATP synthase subunit E [Eubacteriales bacterium]